MEKIEFVLFHQDPNTDAPEGLFAVNQFIGKEDGARLYTSDKKLSQQLAKVIDGTEHEYQLAYYVHHQRKIFDALKAIAIGVKKLTPKRFRVLAKRAIAEQILEISAKQELPVHYLRLTSMHGIRLRDLGPGNERMLTKKERNNLLRLIA